MSSKLLPNNEHNIERVVRIVLGLALLAIVFVGPKTPFGWIGVLPLVTGLIGSCPAYTLFGFSTCKISDKRATAS